MLSSLFLREMLRQLLRKISTKIYDLKQTDWNIHQMLNQYVVDLDHQSWRLKTNARAKDADQTWKVQQEFKRNHYEKLSQKSLVKHSVRNQSETY